MIKVCLKTCKTPKRRAFFRHTGRFPARRGSHSPKRLIKKGLVRLEALKHNRRTKQAIVPPLDRQFMERHLNHMHTVEQQVWRSMEEQERIALTQLNRKVLSVSMDTQQPP